MSTAARVAVSMSMPMAVTAGRATVGIVATPTTVPLSVEVIDVTAAPMTAVTTVTITCRVITSLAVRPAAIAPAATDIAATSGPVPPMAPATDTTLAGVAVT